MWECGVIQREPRADIITEFLFSCLLTEKAFRLPVVMGFQRDNQDSNLKISQALYDFLSHPKRLIVCSAFVTFFLSCIP
jgi:hypothetical protein